MAATLVGVESLVHVCLSVFSFFSSLLALPSFCFSTICLSKVLASCLPKYVGVSCVEVVLCKVVVNDAVVLLPDCCVAHCCASSAVVFVCILLLLAVPCLAFVVVLLPLCMCVQCKFAEAPLACRCVVVVFGC